jgi:SagB-type dehydrogenase family enzyme
MTAREYHERTKHTPESVRRSAHFLDWENQPLPFKIYPDLDPIPLPQDTTAAGVEALDAVAGRRRARAEPWTLEALSHLLYFSAGITKRKRYPGGEILFRAAACTGALYEIELYVVCGELEDLPAGVYHFGPGDLALRRLREGDWRGALAPAPPAPVYIVSTGTYWRNAWKYQARTYRHFGWDNGTILANLLAMAGALGWEAQVLVGFVDAAVNRLLGLDTAKEAALSVTALGDAPVVPEAPAEMPELRLANVPVSRAEVDYPLMREMHAATELRSGEEAGGWRES